jgi:phosphatidylserine/phosphatidylglycerophosphate/cardiolipin synthase-like enzyme
MTDIMTAEAQQAPGAAEQASGAVPPIVDRPCRHYGPNALSWPEHPELESFMRTTYEAHVARSCRSRVFEPSVPETDLAEVAKGKFLRRDAAPLAIRMLDDARDALRQAKAAGDAEALAVRSFGISSAYRSALRQFRLWNDRFGGYLADTAQQRAALPSGPVSDEAAQWLARWIGGWLAAPGFSNHNDGRALDLFCRLTSGRVLTADRGDIPRWRTSWLHQWLTANAAHYDFHPYLKEPWHWEHRPGSASATTLVRPRPAAESDAEADGRQLIAAGPGAGGRQLIAAGPGAAAYWRSQLRFGLAGNTVEPLIDGPAAFRAIQQAIESAEDSTHFIYLLGWWTDPWVNLTGPGTCLLDLFARAGARGVQVRVLVWDAPWGFARHQSNLATEAVHAISRLPNCHAEQDESGNSRKSHHQKLLVVQGRNGLVALCGGVDINADRINDLPPPRGSYRSDRPDVGWEDAGSGGSGSGGSGNPLHDVHARVTGPTALPLLRVFLRRWWARSGDHDFDRRSPLRASFSPSMPAPTGTQFARIGETFNGVLRAPGGNVSSRQVTVQDIWLRSILGARRFIYMEEQYLISDCAAAAIRAVLPRLEHVTILIAPSEITDMPGVWGRRKTFIRRITARNPYAGKLHVYTRTAGQRQPCVRANASHLYVHAKMAVIDDELMLIGSANCNNRGWETDSELVIASFEDDGGTNAVAGGLRMALWAHHLDVHPTDVADPVNSRSLWDTASTRRVCRYDPGGGDDSWLHYRPDYFVDPSDRQPGDPCRTLLPHP